MNSICLKKTRILQISIRHAEEQTMNFLGEILRGIVMAGTLRLASVDEGGREGGSEGGRDGKWRERWGR